MFLINANFFLLYFFFFFLDFNPVIFNALISSNSSIFLKTITIYFRGV